MSIRSSVRRILAPSLAGLLVSACITVQPTLQTAPSLATLGEQKPLRVAVVVPEQVRAFTQAHEIPGNCISGGIQFAPTPIGQQLATTVEDRLKRVFEQVTLIDSTAPRDAYDAAFEIGISDVGFQFGCMISPQQVARVTGSFRAIDQDGREMWRSPTTQGSNTVPFAMVFDMGPLIGGAISQATGQLADSWARELASVDVAQYTSGGSTAARTARRMARRAGRGGGGFARTSLRLEFAQAAEQPDDIAVVIGNGDYGQFGSGIPDVEPAYADSEAFMQYVLQGLGVREGNVIYMRDATSAQMVRVFGSDRDAHGQLYDWVRPGRSRVTVYYSGHGAPAGNDGTAYLVPVDADAARIELNGYSLATLYRNLSKLPAAGVTVILESCFSGVSQGGAVVTRASSIYARARIPEVPANITVITAGQADQVASWEEDGSNGLFTEYYLKAMAGEADARPYGNGDGRVTLAELNAYFADTLTYYARRLYGRDQTPQIVVGGHLMN